MTRESLSVTTVVFAGRTYAVLQREFADLGVGPPGPRVADLFDIGRPTLDWVHLLREDKGSASLPVRSRSALRLKSSFGRCSALYTQGAQSRSVPSRRATLASFLGFVQPI
jgi:hypothetical protein